jgi:hypothetical protein
MAEADVPKKSSGVTFQECCGMVIETDRQTGEILGLSTSCENYEDNNIINVGEEVYAKDDVSLSFINFRMNGGTRAKVVAIKKPVPGHKNVIQVRDYKNRVQDKCPEDIIQLDQMEQGQEFHRRGARLCLS